MQDGERFPFLKHDLATSPERLRAEWFFLHETFSVGIDDDIHFYVDLPLWIKRSNPEGATLTEPKRVLNLYITIHAKCMASADRGASREIFK